MSSDAITLDDVMREIKELPEFPEKYRPLKLAYIRAMILDIVYTAYEQVEEG